MESNKNSKGRKLRVRSTLSLASKFFTYRIKGKGSRKEIMKYAIISLIVCITIVTIVAIIGIMKRK